MCPQQAAPSPWTRIPARRFGATALHLHPAVPPADVVEVVAQIAAQVVAERRPLQYLQFQAEHRLHVVVAELPPLAVLPVMRMVSPIGRGTQRTLHEFLSWEAGGLSR